MKTKMKKSKSKLAMALDLLRHDENPMKVFSYMVEAIREIRDECPEADRLMNYVNTETCYGFKNIDVDSIDSCILSALLAPFPDTRARHIAATLKHYGYQNPPQL